MISFQSIKLFNKISILVFNLVLCWFLPASRAESKTFIINSSADSHDYNPGDGISADNPDSSLSRITLRSSVEEAAALPGADTLFLPDDIGVFRLSLGTLVISDDSTHIVSISGLPIIDGFNNPYGSNTIEIRSDYNSIRGINFRRSRGDAINVTSSYNRIGGNSTAHRNIFVGNGLDYDNSAAVTIESSSATENRITGNFIGVDDNSTIVNANRIGVRLANSCTGNYIGGILGGDRNIISGNSKYGILVESYANNNQIIGNFIGPDSTGMNAPGNKSGGILIRNSAHNNKIGYGSSNLGNLISGNNNFGIRLAGQDVKSNHIYGNKIGSDLSGRKALSNKGNGIEISDGASSNIIGDSTGLEANLISGNEQNGINISGIGTSNNKVIGNLIGTSVSGLGWLGNGMIEGNGILIENGATNNLIGGNGLNERNIISGNSKFGVHITGTGTNRNRITGNYIGLNIRGTSSIYNSTGVAITGGASSNEIGGSIILSEGNVISSNRADQFPYGSGVLIEGEGTDNNLVYGNIIGLDVTKTRARPNYSSGIIIGNGAKKNKIGSGDPLTQNIISGNGSGEYINSVARGIHIFGIGTEYNSISGNLIGHSSDRRLQNKGHGIGIIAGASHNTIGGNFENGNMILHNQGHGVVVDGQLSLYNSIRGNSIMSNDSLDIFLQNGGNGNITPPVITRLIDNRNPLYPYGSISLFLSSVLPGSYIDIYSSPEPTSSGDFEISDWLSYSFTQNNNSIVIRLLSDYYISRDSVFLVTITDGNGNTSQASTPFIIGSVTSNDNGNNVHTELPLDFSLSPNFPNPFNPETNISFSLPHRSEINLTIFNSIGQEMTTLTRGNYPAGEFTFKWDGRDQTGKSVASGVYFYRLTTSDFKQTRKMLLLK